MDAGMLEKWKESAAVRGRSAALHPTGWELLDPAAPAEIEAHQGYAACKRVMDILLAAALLLVCLPILGAAVVLIWLVDGSPALFVQKRVGFGGAEFKMYKLRTMEIASKDEGRRESERPKVQFDPRVTRLGRLLRRTSIDELPQLLNVIKGEMSLVGPRPELPERVGHYEPWQFERLSVPQGITGWWQVTGRSDRPMHQNTEADIYYVRKRSVGLDLVILLRTVWVVLSGRGAY